MMRRIAGQPAALVDVDPLRAMVGVLDVGDGTLRIVSGDEGDPRALVLVRRGRRVLDVVELVGAHGLPERIPGYGGPGEGRGGAGTPREPHAEGGSRPTRTHASPQVPTPTRTSAPTQAPRSGTPVRAWRPGAGAALGASVVICTVGTNPLLTAAVESVLDQEHGDFEVVVVDNAPGREGTRSALAGIRDPRLRIVEEPVPGLSRARNTGVAHSHNEVIAFTDDDALADPGWLPELLDVLGSDTGGEVGGVTGIALPLELRHRSQRFFESRGGFPKDLRPLVWSQGHVSPRIAAFGRAGEGGPLHPLTTARVGAGVSMAFRREVLDIVGPFDPALGAGTATLGGEDMDMFSRVLRAGHAIVHTPDSVTFHSHRPTLGELHRQVRGNGTGSAALVVKALLEDPRRAGHVLARIPHVARRLAPGSDRVSGRDADVPRALTGAEVWGFLQGPLLYLRARASAAGVGGGP